jgi:hypothetical protein
VRGRVVTDRWRREMHDEVWRGCAPGSQSVGGPAARTIASDADVDDVFALMRINCGRIVAWRSVA